MKYIVYILAFLVFASCSNEEKIKNCTPVTKLDTLNIILQLIEKSISENFLADKQSLIKNDSLYVCVKQEANSYIYKNITIYFLNENELKQRSSHSLIHCIKPILTFDTLKQKGHASLINNCFDKYKLCEWQNKSRVNYVFGFSQENCNWKFIKTGKIL